MFFFLSIFWARIFFFKEKTRLAQSYMIKTKLNINFHQELFYILAIHKAMTTLQYEAILLLAILKCLIKYDPTPE